MSGLAQSWTDVVIRLGGEPGPARARGVELTGRYRESHRHYHDQRHVEAVLRDVSWLTGVLAVDPHEAACAFAAALAHDVVYEGRPGRDEQDSADWAAAALSECRVDAATVGRVRSLVLMTADHRLPDDAGGPASASDDGPGDDGPGDDGPDDGPGYGPGIDLAAAALLDADLAILASPPERYDAYVADVRAEYAHVDDAGWRAGRSAVLEGLLDQRPLYRTVPARTRWEAQARANLQRELRGLAAGPRR